MTTRNKAAVNRTKHELPQWPVPLGSRIYITRSWTDAEKVYRQDVAAQSCTCPAGDQGKFCKHLEAANLADFFRAVKVARLQTEKTLNTVLARQIGNRDPVIADACEYVLHARAMGWEDGPEVVAAEIAAEKAERAGEPTETDRKVYA